MPIGIGTLKYEPFVALQVPAGWRAVQFEVPIYPVAPAMT